MRFSSTMSAFKKFHTLLKRSLKCHLTTCLFGPCRHEAEGRAGKLRSLLLLLMTTEVLFLQTHKYK